MYITIYIYTCVYTHTEPSQPGKTDQKNSNQNLKSKIFIPGRGKKTPAQQLHSVLLFSPPPQNSMLEREGGGYLWKGKKHPFLQRRSSCRAQH